MKILHVVPSFAVSWGGPPKIVFQIAEALKTRFSIDILTTHTPGEELVKVPDGVGFFSFERSPVHRFWRSHAPAMKTFLEEHIDEYDLVHIHEVWLYHFYIASKIAVKHKVPFVVTPHGELDAWALHYKGYKKRVFTALFQKALFKQATAIHVGTKKEEGEVMQYAGIPKSRIREIPNALLPESFKLEEESRPLQNITQPYILFMSRLNIKKGCDILLKAFAGWNQKDKYKLVFAGPAEPEAYSIMLQKLAQELGVVDRVMFVGSVHGKVKQQLLANCDLFALTSYAEGFPVAILEALKAGCPLLLSNKCGFDGFLKEQGVAIVCNPNEEDIKKSLSEFESKTQAEIEMIKHAGPKVIVDYFSSEKVTEQYVEMYNDILKTAP